jgi:hypothetical protein
MKSLFHFQELLAIAKQTLVKVDVVYDGMWDGELRAEFFHLLRF